MQLLNMFLYTGITLGVLVFVHELGHFLVARLCGIRTDVFSIGFGTRIFGFNKRSGFSFLKTPPNCITITLEKKPGAKTAISSDVEDILEQVCRDHAARSTMEIIDLELSTEPDYEVITLKITYAVSKSESQLKSLAHQLQSQIEAQLTAKKTEMHVTSLVYSFEGIGVCDYRVALLPLGGYVKIAGMVDESMDTDFVSNEPQPWEFRARPMWQRMLVICAGVIMNVLLAVAIFWAIHYVRGKDTMETTEIGYVVEQSAAQKAGLRAGDKILSINGTPTAHWDELQNILYIENMGNDITFTVDRNGKEESFFLSHIDMPGISEGSLGINIAHTVSFINTVEPGMPADTLGLRPGDTLLTLNNKPITSRQEIITYIKGHAGSSITLGWKRGKELIAGTVNILPEGRIGISIGSVYTGPMRHISYTLSEAFPQGLKETGQSIHLFYLTISKIFVGKASVKESFGGPIAIAQIATQSAELGLLAFLWFMGQLSMTLAIMNILPIPALDGGHLIMLIYEKIFRREIPHKIKLAIQQAGFILLLAFMVFVIYNDISRF